MNNKGSALFVGFMVMMTILVLTLGLAPHVKSFVDTARNATNMDCDNPTISNFDKAACVTIDMGTFYFIAGLIALAFGVFISRRFK